MARANSFSLHAGVSCEWHALQDALLKSLLWDEDLLSGNVRTVDELIERDDLIKDLKIGAGHLEA